MSWFPDVKDVPPLQLRELPEMPVGLDDFLRATAMEGNAIARALGSNGLLFINRGLALSSPDAMPRYAVSL